ncbi:TetR/AcrR family transcriptional regulator [Rhizobium sp. BE258]|uniref:TetR/AcrR family transcriptional regulator n=1 Tax=Rhizobium sp. BE258 TaxID=2817722 RepID=UPI0013AEB9C1|nr:TetR/AcrR family transcriptional regulator [Rhizobium sp. BE258]MDR7144991.1 TetR/AcrR family transcriptional repressor of nem operon [Rhizobium sp. BE258]
MVFLRGAFVGHSTPTSKQEGRDAGNAPILIEAASRCLREVGIAGTSLADVTSAVGMTNGGFYKHFSSREEMVACAVDDEMLILLDQIRDDQSGPRERLDTVVDFLLGSDDTVHSAAVAFGSEIRRQPSSVQEAFRANTKERVAAIARLLPRGSDAERLERAQLIYAALIGAAQLSPFCGTIRKTVRLLVHEIASSLIGSSQYGRPLGDSQETGEHDH